MGEIERFIRIQRHLTLPGGAKRWETLPLADRVQVWAMSKADGDNAEKITIFHVGFIEGVERGCRVMYLGEPLDISSVSDSPKLRGLELRCRVGQDPQALQQRA